MKKTYKYIKRFLGLIISIILLYLTCAFILSIISTSPKEVNCIEKETIYLISNGIHLDIVLEKAHLDSEILSQLKIKKSSKYIAFGWGDRDFYLNTPKWADLKWTTILNAFFLKSKTVMHVTNYSRKRTDFVKIEICKAQLKALIDFVEQSFETNQNVQLIEIEGRGYSNRDHFYEGVGTYNCIKTCNQWVNQGLKAAEIKTSIWSPFDFGVLYQIKKQYD